MGNSLERTPLIDGERLDGERYFESLLAEAARCGMLAPGDVERLQYDCLALLAERVERFNAGDSSSVRVERAESIMASNLFTVGICLKTCQAPDDAVAALLSEPVRALYQRGRRRIGTMLLAAKSLHKLLVGQLFETKNVFYRSAAEDGINGFFKLYDADFAAQEIHITADYPVYIPIPRLAGIEFIRAYLYCLYNENQFCRFFSPGSVHRLLSGYEKDYEELPFNVYEQVLAAALGCVIAGADVTRLAPDGGEAALLQEGFYRMRATEIREALQKAADTLIRRLACKAGLAAYVRNSMPLFADSIHVAAKRRMLHRVFFAV